MSSPYILPPSSPTIEVYGRSDTVSDSFGKPLSFKFNCCVIRHSDLSDFYSHGFQLSYIDFFFSEMISREAAALVQ